MHFETVNCPQCGGPLEGVAQEGFYRCPYCRSHIRVTFTRQDPTRRSDGRMTVFDRQTGAELCYVLLPGGWSAEGSLVPHFQSSNWPMRLDIAAWPPQDPVRIVYQSGASYKDMGSGFMAPAEGTFDQMDMMPVKRLVSPAQYADAIFLSLAGPFQNTWLHDSRPLPQEPAPDYETIKRETYVQISQLIAASTPPGMWSRLDEVYCEGATRIYDYEAGGQSFRMAIAVLIDGVKISFGAGGFFPGTARSYTNWESQYTLRLTAPRDLFDLYYPDYVMFCSTMQASPVLLENFEKERTRISGNLKQAQSDWFNAHMERMRQQQASFDAYNRAWFANSDRRHRAMRRTSASQTSGMDRIFEKYSEAVRGVDTYIRPDGTEVEYSVVNEAAFAHANDSRTTFATQQRDFQSVDWIEMKKKY